MRRYSPPRWPTASRTQGIEEPMSDSGEKLFVLNISVFIVVAIALALQIIWSRPLNHRPVECISFVFMDLLFTRPKETIPYIGVSMRGPIEFFISAGFWLWFTYGNLEN
jgi:hypothetical protein